MKNQILQEKSTQTCCLCGNKFNGHGNNPRPLPIKKETDRCCDDCNTTKVIPQRLMQVFGTKTKF
jgi:hypothetical protein